MNTAPLTVVVIAVLAATVALHGDAQPHPVVPESAPTIIVPVVAANTMSLTCTVEPWRASLG